MTGNNGNNDFWTRAQDGISTVWREASETPIFPGGITILPGAFDNGNTNFSERLQLAYQSSALAYEASFRGMIPIEKERFFYHLEQNAQETGAKIGGYTLGAIGGTAGVIVSIPTSGGSMAVVNGAIGATSGVMIGGAAGHAAGPTVVQFSESSYRTLFGDSPRKILSDELIEGINTALETGIPVENIVSTLQSANVVYNQTDQSAGRDNDRYGSVVDNMVFEDDDGTLYTFQMMKDALEEGIDLSERVYNASDLPPPEKQIPLPTERNHPNVDPLNLNALFEGIDVNWRSSSENENIPNGVIQLAEIKAAINSGGIYLEGHVPEEEIDINRDYLEGLFLAKIEEYERTGEFQEIKNFIDTQNQASIENSDAILDSQTSQLPMSP